MPFACLIVTNSLMISHVYKSARRVHNRILKSNSSTATLGSTNKQSKSDSSKNSLNKTIIASTIMFIIMTLPTAISSFFYAEWNKSDEGKLLINLFDDLSLTYHGCNFFILTIFNRKFRGYLKALIR